MPTRLHENENCLRINLAFSISKAEQHLQEIELAMDYPFTAFTLSLYRLHISIGMTNYFRSALNQTAGEHFTDFNARGNQTLTRILIDGLLAVGDYKLKHSKAFSL